MYYTFLLSQLISFRVNCLNYSKAYGYNNNNLKKKATYILEWLNGSLKHAMK